MLCHVALVELGGSHSETLHSQIHWLHQAGHAVHLVGSPGLQQFILEPERLAGTLEIATVSKQKSPFIAYKQFRRLRAYCQQHGIERLILNTSEINEVRYLIFFARFAGLRCDGILHNGGKLAHSWLLRWLARFHLRHVLVMHDLVLEHTRPVPGVAIESFYPIYFPDLGTHPDAVAGKRLRVVIVGTLATSRKDSIAFATELQSVAIAPDIEIEVLGHFGRETDPALFEMLRRADAFGDRLRCSPGFKDPVTVHQRLRCADLLLPLLYPRGADRFYGEHRVSGAMNSAFGYKVPMLIHESWRGVPDYDASSFYHADHCLVRRINELSTQRLLLRQKKEQMQGDPKFDEEHQGQRYLTFLNLA